jgi:aminoglycoside phosphotransferase (APT) family kinase protein
VKGAAQQFMFKAMADTCAAIATTEQKPTPRSTRHPRDLGRRRGRTRWAGQSLWLHGDLHPANVLTSDGDLCGMVDFGDLCAGDPAFDLAACWILLLDHEAIEHFRAACPLAADKATWRRARGWAIWRASGSLTVATAGNPGGNPAGVRQRSLRCKRLTESVADPRG